MMKYRILPIILLTLLISSCSSSGQDDTVLPEPTPIPTPNPEPQQVSISFGGSSGAWQDAPTTRAGKAGLETLFPSFRIWGYKTTDADYASLSTVMQGYNVLYTSQSSGSSASNSNDWEYVGIANTDLNTTQTIKYWDYSATSYRFFAYSPSDANISVTNQTFSYPFTYKETATNKDFPYISELWFADQSDKDAYGKSVTMTFAPLIAKVRFKFTYPDGITSISVKDIQLQDSRYINSTASADGTAATQADTPLKGTISIAYPQTGMPTSTTPTFSWTTSTETGSTGALILTIPYEDKDTPLHILDEAEYGKWYYVPPLGISSYTQGSYTITARIDGNHSTATVPAEYMQWQPGYQYTYTFKITEAGTQITFADLQVEQWQTAPNTDNNGSGTAGW